MGKLEMLDRRIHEEVWGQGKLELCDELLAPDFVFFDPEAPGGEGRGPDAYKFYVETYREAFPDLKLERIEYMEEGDRLAVRFRMTGTFTGAELMGIKPTGKPVVTELMAFVRFEGEKEKELHLLYDAMSTYEQLGVITRPGAMAAAV